MAQTAATEGGPMTLDDFTKKYPEFSECDLSLVPIKHPETGQKIYVIGIWFAGFWYRFKPGKGDGQMWPCQYLGDKLKLKVYPGAAKELRRNQKNKKTTPA